MNMGLLRFGLLGCGTISQFAHIPALLRARGIELTALCDGAPDLLNSIGARTGVTRLFVDYDEFLESGTFDAVLVAAADEFHFPLVKRALEAGKHVLVEKPLGVSTREGMLLAEAVERSGKKLQVGCMKRYDPGIAFARNFIAERMGEIFSASGWYRDSLFRYEMQDAILPRRLTSFNAIRPSGDPKATNRSHYSLVTHGAHLFDILLFLAGNVNALNAGVVEKHNQHSWHGLLTFSNGALGHFELSVKANGDFTEGYVVHGEYGSVEINTFLPFYNRPSRVRAFDGRTQQWSTPLGADSNPYKNQLEAFARSIQEGRCTSPNVFDGCAVLALLEAVEESVDSKQWVSIASHLERV